MLLGDDGFGKARNVPILGRSVRGPRLSDTILPGNTDDCAFMRNLITRQMAL